MVAAATVELVLLYISNHCCINTVGVWLCNFDHTGTSQQCADPSVDGSSDSSQESSDERDRKKKKQLASGA